MINHNKWIASLPKVNKEISKTINQLDHENSINSIPKKDSYNSVKKYTLLTVLFICGLIFVSIVKNKTRNLQKEINNLETSINLIKFNLDQTFLDHEIITSPENISLLAKKHLNIDLMPYKRSQIKQLNAENEKFTKINKTEKEKTKIQKFKKLYSHPKSIPNEIKTHVAKRIEEKKVEIINIYHEPKSIITLERAGKWTVVQLVKAFLGMPIIPGR
jgi:hypothetical protein